MYLHRLSKPTDRGGGDEEPMDQCERQLNIQMHFGISNRVRIFKFILELANAFESFDKSPGSTNRRETVSILRFGKKIRKENGIWKEHPRRQNLI